MDPASEAQLLQQTFGKTKMANRRLKSACTEVFCSMSAPASENYIGTSVSGESIPERNTQDSNGNQIKALHPNQMLDDVSESTFSSLESSNFGNSSPALERDTFKSIVSADSTVESKSSAKCSTLKESYSQSVPINIIPLSQIKKEEVDPSEKNQTVLSGIAETSEAIKSMPSKVLVNKPWHVGSNEQITFTCASCQFQTTDKAIFMEHARADNGTDLFMWCKQCGKCFGNSLSFVSHVKQRACLKEEMIYRCGVKACTFATLCGQGFVRHLKYFHKGRRYICCVNCEKMFSRPLFLLLHMQDDCLFKDRNRKASSATSEIKTSSKTTPSCIKQQQCITFPKQPVVSHDFKTVSFKDRNKKGWLSSKVKTPRSFQKRNFLTTSRIPDKRKPRSRTPHCNDTLWRSKKPFWPTTLRRSGRWAKRVNDAVHVELSAKESYAKKNFSMSELDSIKMLNCPCCDFTAVFKSVLEDHYIAYHKVFNKNACLVCNLKFEDTKLFLEHFTDHDKTFSNENTDASSNAINEETSVSTSYSVKNDLFESKIDTIEGLEKQYGYPKMLHRICSDFSCGIPFCKTKFEDLFAYINHLRTNHAAVNFICPHCPAVCDTSKDFIEHLQCHGPALYACGLKKCNFFCPNKTVGDEHLKIHAPGTKLVAVRECLKSKKNSQSFDVSKLNSFAIESVAASGKVLECPFCKYKSDNFKVMKNHMYAEIAYKRFSCSYCCLKCCSRKEINDHFTSFHPGHDIKCSIKQNYVLECLVKMYLGQESECRSSTSVSKCSICSKEFLSEIVCQNHLLACAKKEYRPFSCNYCQRDFPDLNSIKYHIDENHFPNSVQYSIAANLSVECEIFKKLKEIRFKFLKNICTELNFKADEVKTRTISKYYFCSLCSFEGDFKRTVKNHMETIHKIKSGLVLKSTKNSSSADNFAQFDNSPQLIRDQVKRYGCGYCLKEIGTIKELESHVESIHSIEDEPQYFYYYSPHEKANFSETATEIFECAYCKGNKGNLFSLKTHFNLIHSGATFKVKSYVVRQKEPSSYLACGHCYLRVESYSELKNHSVAEHPRLPQKSIGHLQKSCLKRGYEELDENGKKRIKFSGAIYECSHCGAVFASQEQIFSHSRQAHSRLQLKFKTDLSSVEEDRKFYKCEFCHFIGGQLFVDKHLSTKHKAIVACFYCEKRFEFATKLKEHHNIFHKNLPWKFRQETVYSPVENESIKYVSHKLRNYKKAPQSFDLNKITLQMDTKKGQIKIPLVYIAQLFDICPKVILNRQEPVNRLMDSELNKCVFEEMGNSPRSKRDVNVHVNNITTQMDTKGRLNKGPAVPFAQLLDMYPKVILKRYEM